MLEAENTRNFIHSILLLVFAAITTSCSYEEEKRHVASCSEEGASADNCSDEGQITELGIFRPVISSTNELPGYKLRLRNKHSGKCLDVRKGGLGRKLLQKTCSKHSQLLKYDYSTYVFSYNTWCLDVAKGTKKNGAYVHTWKCNDSLAQHWTLHKKGKYFVVQNHASSKCLDVHDFNKAENAPIHQFDCNGLDNQKWIVEQFHE